MNINLSLTPLVFLVLLLITLFSTDIVLGADTSDRNKPVMQKEYEMRLKQYSEAAEQGDAQAQINLGMIYERKQDFELAKSWYAKAARQGNAEAQFLYARRHTGRNRLDELKKAAEMGSPQGQYEYALTALQFKAIDRNEQFQWMLKAADNNVTEAQYWVATAYLHDGMSREEKEAGDIPLDEKAAFRWFLRLAETGVDEPYRERKTEAQSRVGWMYYQGRGVRQDYAKAFHWFTKAAESKNYGGYMGLAAMYRNGHFVKQNIKKAEEWASKAKPAPVSY